MPRADELALKQGEAPFCSLCDAIALPRPTAGSVLAAESVRLDGLILGRG